MLSVISVRGCDYMFLCICVLHVDECVACQCGSAAPICREARNLPSALPPNNEAVKCFSMRLRDKLTPYCLMIKYRSLFMVNAAGAAVEMVQIQFTLWLRLRHQQMQEEFNSEQLDLVVDNWRCLTRHPRGFSSSLAKKTRICCHRRSDLMGISSSSFSSCHTFWAQQQQSKQKIYLCSMRRKQMWLCDNTINQ